MRALVFAAPLVGALSLAGPAAAADLMVEDAWIPPSIGQSRTAAAYMTIVNHGLAADRLIGAASTAAGKVELHRSVIERGGVARMQAVPSMDLKPHEPIELRPGGLHLMLTDLKAPLRAGQTVTITLRFQRGGAVDTVVNVGPAPKGTAPAAGHDHGAMRH